MLDIIKKMVISKSIYLLFAILLISCQEKHNIPARVYIKQNITEYNGYLYTTKYGGLNYYIPDTQQREELTRMKNIDSISFNIDNNQYMAMPLPRKPYSRERNNSDFSFFVNGQDNSIIIDTVGNLQTVLLFSENTDIEMLKEKGDIKFEFIDKK